MEESRKKRKIRVGIFRKTWERCKSLNHSQQGGHGVVAQPSSPPPLPHSITENKQVMMEKSKSWSSLLPRTPTTRRSGKWGGSNSKKVGAATPKGCLSVYVGPERERFVLKVESTNHPLFKMLLEEAEMEYGYNSNGPLVLPCDVDVFVKVLYDMDADRMLAQQGCSPIIPTRVTRTSSYHYRALSPPSSTTSALTFNHYNHFL
ncbi:hypothetical protein RND81_02G249000 [Saponaria officinalis]|uniref:Uncharacterized protein n=1 Tax=Saponaria officinalis TaxID=3572 RepID=A0AAW1MZZ6_SAPOF